MKPYPFHHFPTKNINVFKLDIDIAQCKTVLTLPFFKRVKLCMYQIFRNILGSFFKIPFPAKPNQYGPSFHFSTTLFPPPHPLQTTITMHAMQRGPYLSSIISCLPCHLDNSTETETNQISRHLIIIIIIKGVTMTTIFL